MTKNTLPFIYFNEKIGPAADARISIASHSLQYGTSCFGGARGFVKDGKYKVFRLYDHYERLMNASKILGMHYFISFNEFEKIITDLIHTNRPKQDFYIRPFIYSKTEELSPKPVPHLQFELAIYLVELGNYFDPNKGLKLMVSSWRKFSDAMMPTKAKASGCYINSFLVTQEAMQSGYDEGLVLDNQGYIVEASVANLLMVYRGRCIIPEVGSSQLEGITMRSVIDLLKDGGYELSFEKIDRSMVYTCDELMLLGTAAQVAFADSVDKRKIGKITSSEKGPGPICQFLRKEYLSILEGTHTLSKSWVTTL